MWVLDISAFPDFSLPSTHSNARSLDDILKSSKSGYTVIYFYPKDNTPGCSIEADQFTALLPEFEKLQVHVVGASPDNLESHREFVQEKGLKHELLADAKDLMQKVGAYGEKNMYGKITEGVTRSTAILDSKGNIVAKWKSVKADGHAQKVLEKVTKLREQR